MNASRENGIGRAVEFRGDGCCGPMSETGILRAWGVSGGSEGVTSAAIIEDEKGFIHNIMVFNVRFVKISDSKKLSVRLKKLGISQ